MKKIFTYILIGLLTLQIFAFVSTRAEASQEANSEALTTLSTQNITVMENACAKTMFQTLIPQSSLSEIYRKSLEGLANNKFYKLVKQEQLLYLGLDLISFDLRTVPNGTDGEFEIIGIAEAEFVAVDTLQTDNGTEWTIRLGPADGETADSAAKSFFTKIALVQMMLQSMKSEQTYMSTSTTRVELPAGLTLINENEIAEANYMMDFGGGTYAKATTAIERPSTIVLHEEIVVDEQEITVSKEQLYEAYIQKKSLTIRYLEPDTMSIYEVEENNCASGADPMFDFSMPLWTVRPYSLALEEDPLSVSLTVTPSLTLNGHVGWEIGNYFEAWMSIQPSVKAEFVATASGSFEAQWEKEIFSKSTTYWFWVGLLPVWVDLRFSATASVTFKAEASLTLSAEAEASGQLKAGVRWSSAQGWSDISDIQLSADHSGPTVEAEASATLSASIEFQLAFLFYSAAGPYVGFEPYAEAMLTFLPSPSSWILSVGARVNAGATFAGWLKQLLDLQDYSTTLWNQEIKRWEGTFGEITGNNFFLTVLTEQQLYKRGDIVSLSVQATNCMSQQATFWLGVSLRDPTGKYEPYQSLITVSPLSGTAQPGETKVFTVKWTVPSNSPPGYYQIGVTCWKDPGFHEQYTDNILWDTVFYIYELKILTPTSLSPALAGDPSLPSNVSVAVEWIPTFMLPPTPIIDPTFTVKIGGYPANYTMADPLSRLGGIYSLNINAPSQANEGVYDLEVGAFFGPYYSLDTEPSAIEYTSAPSPEPIEKGLAWLRTSQLSDGSWRGSVGVTALCVLAFLNAGYDETDTDVNQATQYILSKVHGDGSIYVASGSKEYETSLAILALVATHNDAHTTRIINARNWIVNSQWDESCLWGSVSKSSWYYGGFGYGSNIRPDLSNTQFAALALDAAELPKDDPVWTKLQVFLHRCQRVSFPITLMIDGQEYTVQPYNSGGFDGGFAYTPGSTSYGSMTGAGIWGLLLAGVAKSDHRVTEAINWVVNHYTWDTNIGPGSRKYYYYLSMAKALTMYGEKIIGGHDWYQDLYDKITNPAEMITVGADKAKWVPLTYEDYVPDLPTAYAILSLQTRAVAPPVQRLSYLTFILKSNCLLRILDSDGNLVGYNYMTHLGENNIPATMYSGPFSEPQYIIIINPKPDTYKLELLGISEGPYTLTIQGNYGEEVTKTFEYTGEIEPSELQSSQVTVTAIVGPLDVYADQPQFEKVIDNIPATTNLIIGQPNYIDPFNNAYASSTTPFTLTATDNPDGTGVKSTFYRIYNSTYDTGWLEYSASFYLTGLSDGEYSIDYNSTDIIGNIEPTNTTSVILDNTPPTQSLTIGEPKYKTNMIYVDQKTPFTIEATDTGSNVQSIVYRIFNVTYDSGWLPYVGSFSPTGLDPGNYTIEYNCTDNVGNRRTDVALVKLRMLTDVTNDGCIDIRDILLAGKAFGSYLGSRRWDPMCDINNDGFIDIRDIFLIARNFATEY